MGRSRNGRNDARSATLPQSSEAGRCSFSAWPLSVLQSAAALGSRSGKPPGDDGARRPGASSSAMRKSRGAGISELSSPQRAEDAGRTNHTGVGDGGHGKARARRKAARERGGGTNDEGEGAKTGAAGNTCGGGMCCGDDAACCAVASSGTADDDDSNEFNVLAFSRNYVRIPDRY